MNFITIKCRQVIVVSNVCLPQVQWIKQ